MQYILSQEEYDYLRRAQRVSLQVSETELQEICTQAANHMPVHRDWTDSTSPWGCILDKGNSPGCCNLCPVKKICPNKAKLFSR